MGKIITCRQKLTLLFCTDLYLERASREQLHIKIHTLSQEVQQVRHSCVREQVCMCVRAYNMRKTETADKLRSFAFDF